MALPEKTVAQDVDEVQADLGGFRPQDRGTETDRRDMIVLGKKQVTRRNFRFLTMLGFASTAMCSWEVLLPFFAWSLIDGGTALLFWGFLATAIVFILIYASIAEIASISPTAGGQYHFVSELAPPHVQKLLSYIVGWLTAVGWQVYLGGTCFITATILQSLIALNVESYEWHAWHATLLSIAFIVFSVVFNSVLAAQLPIVGAVTGSLHLIGSFVIGITILSTASLADPQTTLLEFSNGGGWPAVGLSAMVGLITPMSTLNGYDCSVHMSEEVRDASLTLPRVLMASVGINIGLVFFLLVSFIFTLGDIDSVLQSATRQPFIQVIYNSTQSYVATNILTVMVLVLLTGGCIGEVATTSRQIWSFARDGGLPFSAWRSKVSPTMKVPLRAVLVSVIISSLLACINLGSAAALSAINSLGLTSILTSYYVTISCMIWRRLNGTPLPSRRWSLGRYGLFINIAALVGAAPLWFFAFWPLATPVTLETVNWSPVMFIGAVVLVSICHFTNARHLYRGPVVLVKRDM